MTGVCVGVQEGDRLLWVGQCREDSSVLLASSGGKALHVATTDKELRPLGRPARGLRVKPPPPCLSTPSFLPLHLLPVVEMLCELCYYAALPHRKADTL